jgi:hypothetical protein
MPRSTRKLVRRRHLFIVVIAVILALAFMLFRTQPASASCQMLTLDQRFEIADYVFTGEAIDVVTGDPNDWPRRVTFAPNTVWNGDVQPTYELSNSRPTTNSIRFEADEEYLLFAAADDLGSLRTSICAGSGPVEDAGKVVAALGSGTDVDVTNANITGQDYMRAVTIERLMILGMLALVALTFLYLRWRPPPGHEKDTGNSTQVDRE